MGLPDSPQPVPVEHHERKVRRFSRLVTAVLIVFCNVLLLLGLWVSGINLDELASTPEVFNSKEDVCLRLTWERVTGAADPVRLCSEWIKLQPIATDQISSDPHAEQQHRADEQCQRHQPEIRPYPRVDVIPAVWAASNGDVLRQMMRLS